MSCILSNRVTTHLSNYNNLSNLYQTISNTTMVIVIIAINIIATTWELMNITIIKIINNSISINSSSNIIINNKIRESTVSMLIKTITTIGIKTIRTRIFIKNKGDKKSNWIE